jgi:tetratricopeptide (TPR) repeat protein
MGQMKVRERSEPGLCLLVAALLGGCAALQLRETAPVSPEASAMLAEVRELSWHGGDPSGEVRRDLLARVSRAAPDWVSPDRLLDELDREGLRGPAILERRRAGLAAASDPAARARASYLLGRLSGDGENNSMRAAVRDDPNFAWGHHGLAWSASERGDVEVATLSEERAISLARDPFDRALFTISLARHLHANERGEEAYARLTAFSDEEVLSGADAVWWRAQCASFGLQLEEQDVVKESWRELLGVLSDSRLGEDEAVAMSQQARLARREHRGLDPAGLRLDMALASRAGDDALFQRAQLAHECGRLVRAAALWDQLAEGDLRPPTRERRISGFATGRFRETVERWVDELPACVKDERGRPRSEALQGVMLAARGAIPGRARALGALGDACLAAGWFAEAQALAPHLAAVDTEASLLLTQRADRAFGLLEFFDRSLGKELQPIPEAGAEQRADWLGIERFLVALKDEVGNASALFGEAPTGALMESIPSSPLYKFSPFAALVHPGPVMSRQDQRLGVGPKDSEVKGLAEFGQMIGRFILLGQLAGRDRADGAVFPVLWTERVEGAHLGVKWSGSVVWCEGIEPVGWLGRNRSVTGAALHDGYWIDVEAVRREHERWLELQREWSVEEASVVLDLPAPVARTSAERRALRPLLKEGLRVRLRVMMERGGEVPSLSELLAGVATHEEGHLVDRALHLPLSSHPLRAVRLLGRAAFDPPAVLERLEYRAQVVALCEVADPRLSLAECLLMVESAPSGADMHARGYEALLRDLLRILDERVQRDPASWPNIDPDRALVGQLHRLSVEETRGLGRALADYVGIP